MVTTLWIKQPTCFCSVHGLARQVMIGYANMPHCPGQLWFFKVLRVTAHHAEFLRGDSKVQCSREHSDEFQAPLHPVGRFAHTGCSLTGFAYL